MEEDPSHQSTTQAAFAWLSSGISGVHEYVKEATGDAPASQSDGHDLAC